MDAMGFIESIKGSKDYRGQLVCARRIPRRKARFAEVLPPLAGSTADALANQGIKQLYTHQAESLQAVRRGEHVMAVTATASGKTLCYNVPVLEALEQNPRARALYIYPTKALAQDQLSKLRELNHPVVNAATYDGDTPKRERPFIKQSCNLILTNPDMLHIGILPYHSTWAGLFRNLKFIVIDEVHIYRGVFGSHVANVIRRLRRIARYYGAEPRFICASATVRDPGKLFYDLTGLEAVVIDNDGSPSGRKVFTFWNPPFLAAKGDRKSPNSEAVDMMCNLVRGGVRTLVFAKTRKGAEVILKYAREKLRDTSEELAHRIMAYRGGYRPSERRDIEQRLFRGELLGVSSTNALEVGVDIGGLDAVVITGYPGSIASTWQQAGRAGRGNEESLAVLIGLDDPIDQYLMRNPDYFFEAEHERAIVNPDNPYILIDHLLCAAYELPVGDDEVSELFGERAWDVLAVLAEQGELAYRKRWFWHGTDYPANRISLRSASPDSFNIVSVERGGMLLGNVDYANAFLLVHPGAIYLHAGESYVVTRLDIDDRVAYVEKSDVAYYTSPGSQISIAVEAEIEKRRENGIEVILSDVDVTSRVTHYNRKRLYSEDLMDRVPLELPESRFTTEAAWFALPQKLVDRAIGRGFDIPGSIHALEHAAIGMLPLFAMCDRNDIGGVSHPMHPDADGLAAIFIYDGYAGGVGLARTAYEQFGELMEATLKAIEDCPCYDGCPSCVQSPKCGSGNQPLDKAGAAYLIRGVLERV